jgi:hypothetical protein
MLMSGQRLVIVPCFREADNGKCVCFSILLSKKLSS